MARKKAKGRQRRPKGTGSFFWSESRGVYIGRTQIGTNPDGSPKYTERSDKTEAGLVKKLAALQPATPGMSCREWFAKWYADTGGRRRTRENRENAIRNYFEPSFGHLKLSDLTTGHIDRAVQEWAAILLERKDGDPKPISSITVAGQLSVLHTALAAAQARGLRADNPATGVKPPQVLKKKIRPFTPAELARIVAETTEREPVRLFALIACTGMRIGEALALNVTSFDQSTELLSVTQTQDNQRNRGPTKTRNGVREFRVPRPAIPAVKAAIGERTSGPMFLNSLGVAMDVHPSRVNWRRMLARIGIPYRSPHELRHTIATQMLARGVPIGDVAKFLGDSPEVILATYVHDTGVDVSAAVEIMYAEQGEHKVSAEPPNAAIAKKNKPLA